MRFLIFSWPCPVGCLSSVLCFSLLVVLFHGRRWMLLLLSTIPLQARAATRGTSQRTRAAGGASYAMIPISMW